MYAVFGDEAQNINKINFKLITGIGPTRKKMRDADTNQINDNNVIQEKRERHVVTS